MVPLCMLVIEITFNRQYKDIQINATNLEKGNDEKKGGFCPSQVSWPLARASNNTVLQGPCQWRGTLIPWPHKIQ